MLGAKVGNAPVAFPDMLQAYAEHERLLGGEAEQLLGVAAIEHRQAVVALILKLHRQVEAALLAVLQVDRPLGGLMLGIADEPVAAFNHIDWQLPAEQLADRRPRDRGPHVVRQLDLQREAAVLRLGEIEVRRAERVQHAAQDFQRALAVRLGGDCELMRADLVDLGLLAEHRFQIGVLLSPMGGGTTGLGPVPEMSEQPALVLEHRDGDRDVEAEFHCRPP